MKKLVVTLALLGLGIGSASAVRVAGADHDWTVHFGDRYYGLAGFDAKALPGLRIPTETRLHFGTRAWSFPLGMHIYWVTSAGLGLLGAAAGCSIIWKPRK